MDPAPPTRPWIVLKFGGTSVSSATAWNTIRKVVRERLESGLRPLVVCSALSGVSSALEALVVGAAHGRPFDLEPLRRQHGALAAALGVGAAPLLDGDFEELSRLALGAALVREASPRLLARAMAFGELMSTRLGAAFLLDGGVPTAWYDARELLAAIEEPTAGDWRRFQSAACEHDAEPALAARLGAEPALVVLTQGFIARSASGDTVLLGRGGSDTSASYFAAKLCATRCEIWTDVPGMYTANPRQVPDARLLRRLDHDEAQEIASTGAKVLHPRCIAPVRRHAIPLHIRCTDRPDAAGTVIEAGADSSGAQVKAISAKTGVTLVAMDTPGMWQQVGFLSDIFACFKKHGLSVDLVSTSEMNVTVSLDAAANALDAGALDRLVRDLEPHCKARAIGPCAAVSLVGRNIRAILHKLGPALEIFEEQRIHLVSQAASDLNLTFVVDEDQADRLVRLLHAMLFDTRRADALLGPTWREAFGPEAAADRELPVHAPWWHRRAGELLEVAAGRTPLYVYDEGTLDEAVAALRRMRSVDRLLYAVKANPFGEVLRCLHRAGLGFECVSPGEVERVFGLFPDLDRDRVLFTPNFAPRAEYAWALGHGVRVTLDNLYPLEAWPELFRGHDLFLRVDPGRGRGHHEHVHTAGAESKFGVSADQLDEAARLVRRAGARVVGLHAHKGSGIRSPEEWADTGLLLASVAARFPDATVLDLGGGLGVPERPAQSPLDLEALDRSLLELKRAHRRCEIWLEPGRFLVARAGVLLARVTQLKQKGELHYVGCDAGMNSLLRPALYGAWHEIVNLSRLGQAPTILANVVGPICESGDTLGHARRLAPAVEGDVLLVATTGAYGRSMSSSYNLRDPAAELMLPASSP
jgi:diaminopimelate decarboxylase/aspartate kinase